MFKSLFMRDLSGFFFSNSAYFVFGVYALISMLMSIFRGEYFFADNESMLSFFIFQPQILAVIIPAITMRGWAEEFKSGTIENLFVFPVSSFKLVMSKFLSAGFIVFIMGLFFIPLMITSSFYIKLDTGAILSSYIGMILSSMSLCAASCLASILVPVPSVAYLLGLIFCMLLVNFSPSFLFGFIKDNIPFYIERSLDFNACYQNFLSGQISISAIFYFVSLTALLLYFNWLAVINRRESQ